VNVRVRGALTTVRPATLADIDLLVAWHSDPDVARYWDDEVYTRDELQVRLQRDEVDAFIVEHGAEPVGYVEAWTDDGRSGGLDMFLVPAARGRGLGPDAANALARHLRDERGWDSVTVDPYIWNDVAVRAWRRAGFEPVEERDPDDEHTSRWVLMRFAG
jgi:aminoglycoside 6'-N-acetyltransferase